MEKTKLSNAKRERLQELYKEAVSRNEIRIAQIVKLALDLDAKGEYYKFEQVFSENY